MAKTKPLEVKRVAIAPLVAPVTREALRRLSALTGYSQGEIVDDALAGVIEAYADSPLEFGEKPYLLRSTDLVTIEKATTRVPVKIESERPSVPTGTVTVEKLPTRLIQGRQFLFSQSSRKWKGPIPKPGDRK